MTEAWWIVFGAGLVLSALSLFWRPWRAAMREAEFMKARRLFHYHREHVEAQFIHLAAARSESKLVRWADCDFDDDVAYVRNRITHRLSAFVAVTVAIDGGYGPQGAADLIGNLRVGTAIFEFRHGRWETDGRAMLNLNPNEAIRFYQNDLEVIDQEFAGHS